MSQSPIGGACFAGLVNRHAVFVCVVEQIRNACCLLLCGHFSSVFLHLRRVLPHKFAVNDAPVHAIKRDLRMFRRFEGQFQW